MKNKILIPILACMVMSFTTAKKPLVHKSEKITVANGFIIKQVECDVTGSDSYPYHITIDWNLTTHSITHSSFHNNIINPSTEVDCTPTGACDTTPGGFGITVTSDLTFTYGTLTLIMTAKDYAFD